jgi:hypothetical protein
MDLKDRLGDIETDCCNRLHRWLLQIVGASKQRPHTWHSRALGGAVHGIKSGRATAFCSLSWRSKCRKIQRANRPSID